MKTILLALAVFLSGHLTSGQYHRCPRKESLYPCECRTSTQEIICFEGITNPIDIRYIFQETIPEDSIRSPSPFRYMQLSLENLPVEQLVNKSFEYFVFDDIVIKNNYYLSHLESDAFYPTDLITRTLTLDSNPNLFADSSDAVFNVIVKFVALETLIINRCGLLHLPFDPVLDQANLRRITLTNNHLKTLGPKLFAGLPSLRVLDLSGNQIQDLPRGSLQLNSSSKCLNSYRRENIHYFIDLSENHLTEKSFDNDTLQVNCSLEIKLINNSISYLEEFVFKPLFKHYVKIVIYDNPVECFHCRMEWLYRGRFCPKFNQTLYYYSGVESICDFRNNYDGSNQCESSYDDNNLNYEERFRETDPNLLKCPPVENHSSTRMRLWITAVIIVVVTFLHAMAPL